MSIEGQGHFFTIYFPGFVCFVLYLAKISGERLQDHWSSGFILKSSKLVTLCVKLTNRHLSDAFLVQLSRFITGAFGYLVTGNKPDDITGNYGLQDQKQAIKWISENIQFFGGDSNRVMVLFFPIYFYSESESE